MSVVGHEWEPGDPVYPLGCTAAVDIAGQPYPCEVRGEHVTHANREAEAIWQGAS